MTFFKPVIVISKCLEFDACRYDGQLISNQYVKELKKFINFMPICPEIEIGMGVPRDTIKIVENKSRKILFQPETGKDFSTEMINFSKDYLGSLKKVDGFILKSNSPSCGVKSAKIYSNNKGPALGKGYGFFASEAVSLFPNHPIEEEKRLNNVFLREHFYTAIFTIADFRSVDSIKALYEYHAKHKYLFMSYNQLLMTKMGRAAANDKNRELDAVLVEYYELLLLIFKKKARYTSNINTLMHVMGYFKSIVSSNEKKFFLEMIEMYRNKQVPLSSPSSILHSWIVRFDKDYLLKQSFFNPFPKELIDSDDSRFF